MKFLCIWVLVCYAATQVAIQSQQECIQVYNKKRGKFKSVAPKRKVATNSLSFDRHRAKTCPNPYFLAHSKSS